MSEFWIFGAGGFGREAAVAAGAAGLEVAGLLDDSAVDATIDGLVVSRPSDVAPSDVVVAVADPSVRARLTAELVVAGWSLQSVVDPDVTFRGDCAVGDGAVLLATAFVSTGVRLGDGTQVNYGATIGHDTVTGSYVTVLPGASVAGSVVLEDEVTVGSGAVILQGLTVGRGAVIGAGAVVTNDVAPGVTVVGVPARPVG